MRVSKLHHTIYHYAAFVCAMLLPELGLSVHYELLVLDLSDVAVKFEN